MPTSCHCFWSAVLIVTDSQYRDAAAVAAQAASVACQLPAGLLCGQNE